MANAKEEPKVTKVEMTDGRTVEFVGKRKMIKTSDIEKLAVRIDFINGETRSYAIPPNLVAQFACHGAEQKYGDETAGLEDVEDMVEAVDELDTRIQAGEWTMRREGGGFAGTSVLLRALMELSGKTKEAIRTYLKDKTQVQKMALRNSATLKPIVDRMEAEKASKGAKVDTDALFSELEEVV